MLCPRVLFSCTIMGQRHVQSTAPHLEKHSLLDSVYKLCLFLRITYTAEMLPYAKVGDAIVMKKKKRCLLVGSFHIHTKLQYAQISNAVP